ncbi:hypothetical protein RCL_jg9011.t1 [Rhizophagus clarus]|uniref:G protein gamma domain-containing protein n=1 Tax=Rhizophagus clarus TaxID=94130 RepID=A0A8H3KV73_9GLOM|nr:hypothetical protein RCL_jg9011.t1 [Rhizophagus clarus]
MFLVSSDYSFAERAIIDVWVWLWFIHRVWSTDRFASLQWNKICNFDLKSIITLLIFLMLPVQAIFDIIWTYIKYHEGYIIDPSNHEIYSKPTYSDDFHSLLWSKKDESLKTISEYILTFCFASQIGTLALMQAFWSHLSSQISGKPFMRSWKFRFYVGWVFASMFIFPMARILTDKHKELTDCVPQLIFAFQISPSGHETILRIHYFIGMNESLTFGAFLISVGMLIVILGSLRLFISKVLLDVLIIHINFGSLILWATMILIIYPRYYITGTSDTVLNNSIPTLNGRNDNGHNDPSNPHDKLTNNQPNSYVINLNTTTPTTNTKITPSKSSIPKADESQSNISVEKSINNLLEEQQQQIEIFRHKTSTSISSIVTITSSHAPTSPLIPPPPSFPPVTRENPLQDI